MDMKEVAKFETTVGMLRLSEAIRIGAKIRPQYFGEPFKDGGSCALGAALEATGTAYEESIATSDAAITIGVRFFGNHNALWDTRTRNGEAVCDEIWRRNDRGESRESIADWLEREYGR